MQGALAEIAAGAAVGGALCFVNGELPLPPALSINGYPVQRPTTLARHINSLPATIATPEIRAVAAALADRFPAA